MGGGKPALLQNSYSLLDRGDEGGLVQLCMELGIAYTPFGPLAGGWLTGKYKRDEPAPAGSRMALRPGPYEHLRRPETFAALDRFAEIAERRGVDSATLAIAWLLAQPWVTAVVVGPRRPEQLAPALMALEHPLTRVDADELGATLRALGRKPLDDPLAVVAAVAQAVVHPVVAVLPELVGLRNEAVATPVIGPPHVAAFVLASELGEA